MIDEFVELSFPVYLFPPAGDAPLPEREEYLQTNADAERLARQWRAELRRSNEAPCTEDGLDRVVRGEPLPTRLGVPLSCPADLQEFWRRRKHRKVTDAYKAETKAGREQRMYDAQIQSAAAASALAANSDRWGRHPPDY